PEGAVQDHRLALGGVEQSAAVATGPVARYRAAEDGEHASVPDAAPVPRGAVVVDGAVCDRQRAALHPEAAAGTVLGDVVVGGAAVDGDGTTRCGDAAAQPDRSAGDGMLVAADLAAVGNDHRVAQEGADAAAEHQRVLVADPLEDLRELGAGLGDRLSDLLAGLAQGSPPLPPRSAREGVDNLQDQIVEGREDVLQRHGVRGGVVVRLAAADGHAPERPGEVDDAAADRAAGVVVDLAVRDGDLAVEVGGDTAARAVARVVSDAAVAADTHVTDDHDDGAAAHAAGGVVLDAATAGDRHVAHDVKDAAVAEPRVAADVPRHRAAADDVHVADAHEDAAGNVGVVVLDAAGAADGDGAEGDEDAARRAAHHVAHRVGGRDGAVAADGAAVGEAHLARVHGDAAAVAASERAVPL